MFRYGSEFRGETENIIAYIIYLGISDKKSPGVVFVENIEQFKRLHNRPAFRELHTVRIHNQVEEEFYWGRIIEHIMDYKNTVLFLKLCVAFFYRCIKMCVDAKRG